MAPKTSTSTVAAKRTPLPIELLRRLYSAMLRSRMAEERLRLLASAGKLTSPYPSIIGHEATEIGAAAQLAAADTLAPSRAGLFPHIAAGSPIRPALAPYLGSNITTADDNAPRLLAPTTDFAARLNVATGIALGSLREKDDSVVLIYATDADSVPDSWQYSFALAAAQRLPILYILENTRWATDNASPEKKPVSKKAAVAKSSPDSLIAAAERFAIPAITVDGNDVVAIYRVAHEALHRARLRRGATFINALVSPWRRNAVTDSTRPRTAAEIEHWQGRDPLAHMELYMSWYGIWSNDWKQLQVEQFQGELDAALKPMPPKKTKRG